MPVAATTRRATSAHCESVRSGCRGSERTEQTHTGRSGARAPRRVDGRVEGVGQVRQHVGLGEHLDRGAVAVPGDQAGVGVVAALAPGPYRYVSRPAVWLARCRWAITASTSKGSGEREPGWPGRQG